MKARINSQLAQDRALLDGDTSAGLRRIMKNDQDRLRELEETGTRKLQELSDRVSELSSADVEYHYSTAEATAYLAYAHAPENRVSINGQHLLDMDNADMQRGALQAFDVLDRMEMESGPSE